MSLKAIEAWCAVAWAFVRRYWWVFVAGLLALAYLFMRLTKPGRIDTPSRPSPFEDISEESARDLAQRLQDKIDSATVDIKIERERARVKTDTQREKLKEIKSEKTPRLKQEKLASWLTENL